jgi:hypothetical protein
MRITKTGCDHFSLTTTGDELMILNNVLNEVCNGIEVDEFSTRIGVPVEVVRELLAVVHETLDKADLRASSGPG